MIALCCRIVYTSYQPIDIWILWGMICDIGWLWWSWTWGRTQFNRSRIRGWSWGNRYLTDFLNGTIQRSACTSKSYRASMCNVLLITSLCGAVPHDMTIFSSRLNLNTTVTFIWRSGLINFVTIIFTDIISSWVVLIVTFVVDTIISIFFWSFHVNLRTIVVCIDIYIYINILIVITTPYYIATLFLLVTYLRVVLITMTSIIFISIFFYLYITFGMLFHSIYDFVNNIDILVWRGILISTIMLVALVFILVIRIFLNRCILLVHNVFLNGWIFWMRWVYYIGRIFLLGSFFSPLWSIIQYHNSIISFNIL